MDLVDGLGAGFDRIAAGDARHADGLDQAIAAFGGAGGPSGEHGRGGGVGVDRSDLPLARRVARSGRSTSTTVVPAAVSTRAGSAP
ncbi:hypothetical protein [Saccharothrix saharensis]|uniref:hypothetical protein n=1 Tax=Saccharothrix saharensis TaxID=571190 RepID=UPI001FEBD1EB|nr:hypothetical protein [Saccharothrix saharensis]